MQAAEYHHFGFYTSALAVNLLDRFMAAQPTSDEELWTLQLAAVACLSIAAKMEEGIMPADIAELQVGSLSLLHLCCTLACPLVLRQEKGARRSQGRFCDMHK